MGEPTDVIRTPWIVQKLRNQYVGLEPWSQGRGPSANLLIVYQIETSVDVQDLSRAYHWTE